MKITVNDGDVGPGNSKDTRYHSVDFEFDGTAESATFSVVIPNIGLPEEHSAAAKVRAITLARKIIGTT